MFGETSAVIVENNSNYNQAKEWVKLDKHYYPNLLSQWNKPTWPQGLCVGLSQQSLLMEWKYIIGIAQIMNIERRVKSNSPPL